MPSKTGNLRNNVGPSDQTPVLADSPTDGNLLADFSAGRAGERDLGNIGLHTQNLGTGSSRANVHHQNLILGQLRNLGLFTVCGPDTKQSAEQEVVDLDLGVDGGQTASVTQDETNQTIGTCFND